MWQASVHEVQKSKELSRVVPGELLESEADDVEAQIRNLRSQLLWLENSRTVSTADINFSRSFNCILKGQWFLNMNCGFSNVYIE